MANDECLFCKIASHAIPADVVAEDDRMIAFRDLNPQAPTHVLVIPKDHIATTNALTEAHEALVGHLVRVAAEIAAHEGLATPGYRLVLNCNRDAGQSVFHVHLHLLGGRALAWPPG